MPRVHHLSLTGKHGPLPEATWNFSRVPDDEIVACCLWEYARESRSIALAAEVHQMNTRHIRPENHPQPTEEQIAIWAEHDNYVRRRVKAARFDYEKFLGRFWASELGFHKFYDLIRESCTGGAKPFQTYPKKLRRFMVGKLSETMIYTPLVESSVGELELLWKHNSIALEEVRSQARSPDDDSEDVALYDRSNYFSCDFDENRPEDRTRTVELKIDFSRFTDAEIEAAFHRWVLKHRPRRWRLPATVFPTATRRGRKINDYRVALERLAIMRLLNQLPPSELRTKIPVAWELYGHKSHDFRREIRAAVRFFRERFPFLPARERPESERRYGTWWPKLQKDLDEMDAGEGRK